ncbi:MAG: cytochrome d ubiquinol oxidase subunit II [Acidimicrobiales bacterium]
MFLWTGFPRVFAALVTAVFIPMLGVGVGIIFRGGAFVFRKSSSSFEQARFFGALFAVSSLVTPFFLGAAVGAVASGRVRLDQPIDPWQVWMTPTSLLGGALAVGTCMWLAAVFLAADADRDGQPHLTAYFTRRSQITAVVLGMVSLVGIYVIESDASSLADGLETWGAPLIVASGACGLATMYLLARGRPQVARVPAVGAVVSVLVGWGVGQYPWMLVDEIEIADAATSSATLWALVVAFALAVVLVIPSLFWLLRLTAEGALSTDQSRGDSSFARLESLEGEH